MENWGSSHFNPAFLTDVEQQLTQLERERRKEKTMK